MSKPTRQAGAVMVEFALVSVILLTLVIGAIVLGLALFKWNAGAEASRRGARTAAIVAMNDTTAIVAEMRHAFPEIDAADITVEYSADGAFPGSCVPGTCRYVRVRVARPFPRIAFFLPAIPMAPFSTTYPVEALGNYGP